MAPGIGWWVVPLLTFAGVLLAQAVVLYGLFARQRADDQRRWHEKRVEAYLELLAAAHEVIEPLILLGHAPPTTAQNQPAEATSREALMRRLELSAVKADEAFIPVRLLGTDPVRTAAYELWKILKEWSVDDAMDQVQYDPETSREIWGGLLADATARRGEFEAKIRDEIGIKSPMKVYSIEAESRFALILAALRALVRKRPATDAPH